jgi:hypothetical protein
VQATHLSSDYAVLGTGHPADLVMTRRLDATLWSLLHARAPGLTLADVLLDLLLAGDPAGHERWKPLRPARHWPYALWLHPFGLLAWRWQAGEAAVQQDTFNRADSSTLGTSSDSSFTWEECDAGLSIVTNKLAGDTSEYAVARTDTNLSSDAMYSQADRSGPSSTLYYGGTTIRHSPSDCATFYSNRAQINTVPNLITQLTKVVSGTATTLATQSEATAGADTVYIEGDGSTLKCKHNGSVVVTATDTAISGYKRAGVEVQAFSGLVAQLDNFEAGDLTPTVPSHVESGVGGSPHRRGVRPGW